MSERRLKRRDAHHLASTKAAWEAHRDSTAIRNNNSLIAHDMLRLDHELLHSEQSHVPVPSIYTLEYVARNLEDDLNPLQGIDRYSQLVEEAIRNPRAKDVEQQLGELSIMAMRLQIPYIKNGTRRYL